MLQEDVGANVIYCVVQFMYSDKIQQKISLLNTALTFMHYYAKKDEKKRIEKLQKQLHKILSDVNWELYEQCKSGKFDITVDTVAEFRRIGSEYITQLEEIKNNLLVILLDMNITDVKFPEPV